MAKVVYLFGAGASMNAVPLAKDIKGPDGSILKIGLKSALITYIVEKLAEGKVKENYPNYETYKGEYDTIITELKKFDTIDTYAKYLSNIKNEYYLGYLKNMLNAFFHSLNESEKINEYRYLNLITSIFDGTASIESDFVFLSYNYDFALEIAFTEATNYEMKVNKNHNILKKLQSYPSVENGWMYKSQFIIHLNGIAGMREENGKIWHSSFKNTSTKAEEFLYTGNLKIKNLLKFGWEVDKDITSTIVSINDKLTNAESLIIIGYSFPFFNRKYDEMIIAKFCESTSPKKIYIQNPYNNTEAFKQRFKIDNRRIEVIYIDDCEYHYIPYDL
jgi:hypothetical protein